MAPETSSAAYDARMLPPVPIEHNPIHVQRVYFMPQYTPNKEVPHLTRWLLFETVMCRHLFCVFTYIYSVVIDKDICGCRNVSVKFPCVYLCLSSGDLFIFSFNFLFYPYFGTFPSHKVLYNLFMEMLYIA